MSRNPPPPPFAVLRGHLDAVSTVTFVNSSLLASGGCDGQLRLWSIPDRRCIFAKQVHSIALLSVIPYRDNDEETVECTKLLTHSRDGFMKLWNVAHLIDESMPFNPIWSANHRAIQFCNIDVHDMTSLIACPAIEESRISFWEIRFPHCIHYIDTFNDSGHEGRWGMLTSIRFINNNSYMLMTGWENGTIAIFDIRSYQLLTSLQLHTSPIMSASCTALPPSASAGAHSNLAYSHANTTAATNSSSQFRDNEEMYIVATGSADRLIIFSRLQVKKAASSGGDGRTRESDANLTSKVDLGASITTIADRADSDGKSKSSSNISLLSTALRDMNVLKPDADIRPYDSSVKLQTDESPDASPYIITKKHTVELPKEGTGSLSFRSDGRIVACGLWDNTIRLYESKSAKPLAILNHHRSSVFAVAFDSSGVFASGSKDGTIAVWNIYANTMK